MNDGAKKESISSSTPVSARLRLAGWTFAAVAGAAGGFAWYYFVGCPTGTCPLSSNPWIMTLGGAVMGLGVAGSGRRSP